jgi:putative endonuclease
LASHSRRSETGRAGEREARERLESIGYQTLATNYRTRSGEIDIVALHRGQAVFVEVKTRRSRTYGLPEEAITGAKARRLAAAAQSYLAREGRRGAEWRIDVVVVELGPQGKVERLEVIENAVGDPRR